LGGNNLFRRNDFHDLSRKIDYWFEHPEERQACSKGYASYCGQFDSERCMDKMEKMILATSHLREIPSRPKEGS
jgi:1,2-diacylglycerol 3-alpha-glucosyltransferase